MTRLPYFWHLATWSDGCWPWAGKIQSVARYGLYGRRLAHRVAYTLAVGPIPEGMEIDHLCRNRACVNPAHMEPVTHRMNALRGEGVGAVHSRKATCPNGHAYELSYPSDHGRRRCRRCRSNQRRMVAA